MGNIVKDTSPMKPGDIFITSLENLGIWEKTDHNPGVYRYSCDGDFRLKYYYPNTLIIVKYLGNGIVKEMITGERFIISDYDLSDKDELSTIKREYVTLDNQNEYGIEEYSLGEHVTKLQKVKEQLLLYPLSICGCDLYREITEEDKKNYVKVSDEDRIKAIQDLKEYALINSKSLLNDIETDISRYDLNDEMISIAYLENQLIDFQTKKRAKKKRKELL